MGNVIHVTEVMEYLRCRRMWDFTSNNRQGLVRVGPPTPAFHLGSAIHHALDAQLRGEDPQEALAQYFEEQEERTRNEYKAVVGVYPSMAEMAPALEVQDLAHTLIKLYVQKYGGANPLTPYECLESEVSFKVRIPGTRGYLTGTFDALVRHAAREDERWVLERKTFSNAPNEDDLVVNPQLTLYAWAAERLFGRPVSGVLYDGIGKRVARKPEGNFIRHKVYIPRASLERWMIDLPKVYREMMSSKTAIIPDFRREGCWDCGVRDLCHATQFGEDVAHVMLHYRRGEGHRTVRALMRPARTVADLSPARREA